MSSSDQVFKAKEQFRDVTEGFLQGNLASNDLGGKR